jgi:hypothetical protein
MMIAWVKMRTVSRLTPSFFWISIPLRNTFKGSSSHSSISLPHKEKRRQKIQYRTSRRKNTARDIMSWNTRRRKTLHEQSRKRKFSASKLTGNDDKTSKNASMQLKILSWRTKRTRIQIGKEASFLSHLLKAFVFTMTRGLSVSFFSYHVLCITFYMRALFALFLSVMPILCVYQRHELLHSCLWWRSFSLILFFVGLEATKTRKLFPLIEGPSRVL